MYPCYPKRNLHANTILLVASQWCFKLEKAYLLKFFSHPQSNKSPHMNDHIYTWDIRCIYKSSFKNVKLLKWRLFGQLHIIISTMSNYNSKKNYYNLDPRDLNLKNKFRNFKASNLTRLSNIVISQTSTRTRENPHNKKNHLIYDVFLKYSFVNCFWLVSLQKKIAFVKKLRWKISK
jgi:hypothetical protein